jgi:hypothetical protein
MKIYRTKETKERAAKTVSFSLKKQYVMGAYFNSKVTYTFCNAMYCKMTYYPKSHIISS